MGDDTKKERGERIRALRKDKGITLEALAKDLGIRYQSICEWERGDTSPSVDNISKLSVRFGVHPTWVWTGQGPKYVEKSGRSKDEVKENFTSYETPAYSRQEKEYIYKLIGILKGKNEEATTAIKTSIDIFYRYCHKK